MLVSIFDQLQIENRLRGWIFDVLNQVASEKRPNLKQKEKNPKPTPTTQELFASVGL